jgi:hypothetical protein
MGTEPPSCYLIYNLVVITSEWANEGATEARFASTFYFGVLTCVGPDSPIHSVRQINSIVYIKSKFEPELNGRQRGWDFWSRKNNNGAFGLRIFLAGNHAGCLRYHKNIFDVPHQISSHHFSEALFKLSCDLAAAGIESRTFR